ncbi:MAG: peptidoglycan DD-metalloendopeptidase family protein [Prevotellaceae bacterium]|jgi:murein DD-endopeptidase MepM/ murein hydrolase activator NlpD|nr:peptidoglycan DD-metalloendopeptidase family protein [Prevotellaceae bacterium]
MPTLTHKSRRFTTALLLLLAALQAPAQPADRQPAHDTDSLYLPMDGEPETSSLDEDPGDAVGFAAIIAENDTFPAHTLYKIWTGEKVNPYDIRMVDMPDTAVINLSGYCHPVSNRVTSRFGFRKWRHHYGIDLRLKRGDSVLCAFDGMVRIARRSRTFGNYAVVRHYNGLETIYAHLSKLLVIPNQPLKAGDLLGWGGNTGRSTGPHLHYELRYLGAAIDPENIIDFEHGTTLGDTLYLTARHFDYIREIEKIRLWTVRKGDTLGHIAQRTGISISTLCRLNGISRKSILRRGQKIRYT